MNSRGMISETFLALYVFGVGEKGLADVGEAMVSVGPAEVGFIDSGRVVTALRRGHVGWCFGAREPGA